MKRLVQVKVTLHDSSVDLNDPAVKEQILKQASLQNPPLKKHELIHEGDEWM